MVVWRSIVWRPIELICRPHPFPTKNLIQMPIIIYFASLLSHQHNNIELSFVPAAAGDPSVFSGHECGCR